MKTILLISPYWKEEHRWMASSPKLAELWQRLGYRVVGAYMGSQNSVTEVSPTLKLYAKKDYFLPDPWNTGIAFGFTSFVKRIIRDEKPDIIVVNKVLFWTSLSLILLRLSGKKVILITDALVGMTWWPRSLLPKIVAFLSAWTVGWLILLSASRIVFFHPQPQGLLGALGVRKKSQVIPTGIDPSLYHSEKKGDDVTITYVGRLESVKGVDDFLAAAAPLITPSVKVQVVGGHDPSHLLIASYQHKVSFLGLRKDIPEILSKTDIFVLPSYSEGLSNALMEAMSSGCACIASAVGGNRYLLADGAGVLFPAGNREVLRDELKTLIADASKRQDLQKRARQRIENVFSWNVTGRQYEALFSSFHS